MKATLKRYFFSFRHALVRHRTLLSLSLMVFLSVFATFYFYDNHQGAAKNNLMLDGGGQRDYRRSPFNYSDAYEYCVLEAKSQLGNELLRYTMDNLSSHYKQVENVYFIVLKVDIGTLEEFRGASIYCRVDPVAHVVSYYKEVFPGEDRSILSRTIEFFSRD